MDVTPAQHDSSFSFERDTFAFANELVWQYRFDARGRMSFSRNVPRPAYTHRCFVVVRAARLFHYHSRFAPEHKTVDPSACQQLIRQVISRSPRKPSPLERRIIIPGYPGLREFSVANEPLLKAELGGAWRSYILRSHWRMVFPVGRKHQQRIAEQLQRALRTGSSPIVHVFCFPRITINHGLLLFGVRRTDQEVQFDAYDPNIPARPVTLTYHEPDRTFRFPPSTYWSGGPLNVVEIFCGGLY